MTVLRLPITVEIDLDQLKDLLRRLNEPGAVEGAEARPMESGGDELPRHWRQIDERHGVTYRWGDDEDTYDPFRVFEAELPNGRKTSLAIGKCERARTFGTDRVYYITMLIGPSGGMRAVAEFLATDDYDQTGDVIAIVKGKEGTGRQFDDPTELPPVYSRWNTTVYRDRVEYPGSFTKQALVCHEDDFEVMLNHSLTQIRIRDL